MAKKKVFVNFDFDKVLKDFGIGRRSLQIPRPRRSTSR